MSDVATPAVEPEVDMSLAKEHGLTEAEYGWIVDRLGRTPTFVELGIYSVMWSEHCSYKNSIALLKTLPRDGEALLVGAGEENAGLVDIGDGLAVAFKIESHNHPSAVEPYQGAATGVGGIQRDIFTMGARPICSLNSLRFGSLDDPRVRYLFDGVVRGIGDYGNSFGVPTVAGEVYFDPCYGDNPLVNAMSVGLVKVGETASAVASGPGNPVYIVGSATGRDGIHGATFASEEISEASEAKRPSVQVGDPFTEKLLLEASLEAIGSGAVVGIQDMGAAGITCSSTEMSAKGKSGMIIHADRVPMREEGMTPYEVLLSESQERMLVVVEQGRESEIERIFEKWDLHAVCIGEVIEEDRVRVFWHGDLVADVPAEHLVLGGGAPVYYREAREPAYLAELGRFNLASIPDVDPDVRGARGYSGVTENTPSGDGSAPVLPDASPGIRQAGAVLERLLGSPNLCSREWVYRQYDTMVRTNTVVGPGPSDAAVVRIKHTRKGLAVKTDCNGRYVYLNPRRGARIAVCEAARNVVCAGGEPLAVTNCLNFGNPYKPEMYWTLREAVAGLGEACRALNTPVTGGNVSLYNESPDRAVFPTPTIGMVGLVEDVDRDATTLALPADMTLLLVTPQGWVFRDDLGGSEYLSVLHGETGADAPHLDLEEERAVQQAVLRLIRSGWVEAAHDVSDGGLAVCLAEMCMAGGVGCEVDLNTAAAGPVGLRLDSLLFGEAQSRIVLTVAADSVVPAVALVDRAGARATPIGRTGGADVVIRRDGVPVISRAVRALRRAHDDAMPAIMAS